jgi:multiple sugar transport system substrate-binding protein
MIARRDVLKSAGFAAAALAAAPLIDACSSSSAGSTPSSSIGSRPKVVKGHVALAFFGAADIIKAWTPIFADFRSSYPQVTLEAVPIPAATWTAYADSAILQMAGGRSFDILQAATNIQQLFIGKGVVEALDPYITRDKAELASYFSDENPKFLSWNKNLISRGGPLYYLPADYNTYCAWINTQMFKEAGVPVPSDGWTWNDLLAAGKEITKTKGKYLIYVDPSDMFFFQPWALTNGGTLLSADWSKSTLDSPQTITAARFAQSLVLKGYSPKPGGSFDVVTEFAANNLAIFGCGMWLNPTLKTAGGATKAKVVAWPKNTQMGTSVGWNAYPIVKSSQNKEAAWAFLKYLASKHAVTNLALTGQATPGRKSVFYDVLPQAAPEQGLGELWTSVNYATPTPSPAAADAVNNAIIKTMTQIYGSSADPAPLMRALNTQVTGFLSSSNSPGGG